MGIPCRQPILEVFTICWFNSRQGSHFGAVSQLEGSGEGGAAYAAANERILYEALSLAGVPTGLAPQPAGPVSLGAVLAVIVWNGRSRGANDATEQFAASAQRRALAVEQVLTI